MLAVEELVRELGQSHVPVLLFSNPDWLTTLADLVESKVMHG